MSGIWIQVSENRQRWYPSEEAYLRSTGQSEFMSAGVIDDTMPATVHPCTGETFESKSAFRRVTKLHGCIEIGNEKLSEMPERKITQLPKAEVKEALLRSLDIHGHRRD